MEVNVRHDLRRLESELRDYPREAMQAAVRALNRTATTVRAEGARRMADELPGLRINSIRGQIKLGRATNETPKATLTFSKSRFRLFGNFASRQTKRGVSLRRTPWRIETLDGQEVRPDELRSAFIARSTRGSTRPHVWVRVGKSRYPITALLAPSLAAAFVERRVGEALVLIGRQRFAVAFEQEKRFRLGKRGIA